MTDTDKDIKEASRQIVKDLQPLAEHIKQIQDMADAVGLFMGHRDIASCLDCDLHEDVDAHGRLYVFKGKAINFPFPADFKFDDVEGEAVKCPGCGKIFCPIDPSLNFK